MKKKLVDSFWQLYNKSEAKLRKLARNIPDSITPNFLTLIRIILTIPIVIAVEERHYFLATILFFIAYFLDIIDGPLAREKGLVTEFGKIFDPTADKVVFLSVLYFLGKDYLPLALLYVIFSFEMFLVALVLVFKPLASLLKLKAKLGANIFGKIKMFLQTLGIITLLLLVAFNHNVLPATIIFIMATVFSGFSILGHLLSVHKKKTPS